MACKVLSIKDKVDNEFEEDQVYATDCAVSIVFFSVAIFDHENMKRSITTMRTLTRTGFGRVSAFTATTLPRDCDHGWRPRQREGTMSSYTTLSTEFSSFMSKRQSSLLSTTGMNQLGNSALFSTSTTTSTTSSEVDTNKNKDTTAVQEGQRLFPEELNVLYDSKCSVCKLEIDWLARRDARLNNPPKLRMTDLESPDFDPFDKSNGGVDYATGMAAIYGIKSETGEVLCGIPVFQEAYERVGLGWLWKISQVPAARKVLDVGYDVFAKYRTRITRGSSLEELVRLHEEKKRNSDCEECQTTKV